MQLLRLNLGAGRAMAKICLRRFRQFPEWSAIARQRQGNVSQFQNQDLHAMEWPPFRRLCALKLERLPSLDVP